MSVFSLFNIFDPDQVTVVSIISAQYTCRCFPPLFLSLPEFLISCMYNKEVKYRQSFPITFKNFPKLCNEYLILLVSYF